MKLQNIVSKLYSIRLYNKNSSLWDGLSFLISFVNVNHKVSILESVVFCQTIDFILKNIFAL
jgi:hypothetical protein